jgi:AcrR family transcriptional regulator
VAKTAKASLSLRERHKLQTREHLLDIAGKLIARDGFAETTVDDIAAASGTSRATVYAYFPTKEDILSAMAGEMFDRANDLYLNFAMLPDWSLPTIRGWLSQVSEAWQANKVRTTAVVRYFVILDAAKRNDQFIETLTARAGLWSKFSAAERRARALLLISTVQMFFTGWYVEGWKFDEDLAMDILADACYTILHPSSRGNPL